MRDNEQKNSSGGKRYSQHRLQGMGGKGTQAHDPIQCAIHG